VEAFDFAVGLGRCGPVSFTFVPVLLHALCQSRDR
jgi:hypothetical protein